MTLTKAVSWVLFLLSIGGCVYMLGTFGWLLLHPEAVPMPIVFEMFTRMYWLCLAIGLTGICYVICRVARI